MELELKKECIEAYDLCGNLTLTQEDTTETIVPDYCPDIARIISTEGTVFIHSRDVREGRGELSGSVRVNVLYTPEGESGIRVLEFAMPFTVASEPNSLPECLFLSAVCKIDLLESRMLNPRKVFTRCKLVTQMIGYQKKPLCFSSDIEAEEKLSIEKNRVNQHITLLKNIAEKDYTFTETINLSPGRQGANELLGNRITSMVTETKLIGNKLVYKGLFNIFLLYRGNDGQVNASSVELPFSQIMEMEGVSEKSQVSLKMQLTGTDLQIDGADAEGREIAVTLYFHAIAFVREEEQITLLRDLYSTAFETSYETKPVSICSLYEKVNRRQTVREVLEIGVIASTILSAKASCGNVSVSRDGEVALLRSNVAVQVLYLDEGGSCLVAERSIEVSSQLELPHNCTIHATAFCGQELQATLGDHGIEVRFAVDFEADVSSNLMKITIEKVELDQNAMKDLTGAPSLVLRCCNQDESAWELAKKYNTTISEILSANQIEQEDELPSDRMLLIPHKRA